MSYYRVLGLHKEPFSTSPDPDFLYFTQAHQSVLMNVLIELRLKRGLSVILGDVGTGKTTLARKVIQSLKERGDFIVHYILDPSFENEYEFLSTLIRNFDVNLEDYCPTRTRPGPATALDLKEALEKFLYDRCFLENRSVVLIIDEAQKLNEVSIEMLRVLLNYETNENKLLQLVLFGQLELYSKLMPISNFADRISFKYTLNPLGLRETRELIQFRLAAAGYSRKEPLFDEEALNLIHKVSKGYPRKTTSLCHRALKRLIMNDKRRVDGDCVRRMAEEDVESGWLMPISL